MPIFLDIHLSLHRKTEIHIRPPARDYGFAASLFHTSWLSLSIHSPLYETHHSLWLQSEGNLRRSFICWSFGFQFLSIFSKGIHLFTPVFINNNLPSAYFVLIMRVINKAGLSFPYKTWNLTDKKKSIQTNITKPFELHGRKTAQISCCGKGKKAWSHQGLGQSLQWGKSPITLRACSMTVVYGMWCRWNFFSIRNGT